MSVDVGVELVPKPIEVGPEMDTLRRFYPDCTWRGRIHEGGMGPGTPAMRGVGRATFQPIQDGRWFAGDFEQDQFLDDGTFVLTWKLHWVSGWSPSCGESRASMVDDYGNADVYRGWIDRDRLVFESLPGTGPPAVHVGRLASWGDHLKPPAPPSSRRQRGDGRPRPHTWWTSTR